LFQGPGGPGAVTEAITREIYLDFWAMKKVEEKRRIRYQPGVSWAW